MARMLGAFSKNWCPICRGPSGLDCPDKSRSKKAQRALEERQWRQEVATDGTRFPSPDH